MARRVKVICILPITLLIAVGHIESMAAEDQPKHLRRCFGIIVRDMSADWWTLGHDLDLLHNDIRGIEQQYLKDPAQCCRAVLEKWLQREGASAKKQTLLSTLEDMGRKDVADKLEGLNVDYFKESDVYNFYMYLLQLWEVAGLDTFVLPENNTLKVCCTVVAAGFSVVLSIAAAKSVRAKRATESPEDLPIDDDESVEDVPIPPGESQGDELVPLSTADQPISGGRGVDTGSLYDDALTFNPDHYGYESELETSLNTLTKVKVRNKRCTCM